MLKTVKIGFPEYKAMKAIAKKRGMLLQFTLTEALRQYITAEQAKERIA